MIWKRAIKEKLAVKLRPYYLEVLKAIDRRYRFLLSEPQTTGLEMLKTGPLNPFFYTPILLEKDLEMAHTIVVPDPFLQDGSSSE